MMVMDSEAGLAWSALHDRIDDARVALVTGRSLADGQTAAEAQLVRLFARELRPELAALYQAILDRLDTVPGEYYSIRRWALDILNTGRLADAVEAVLRRYLVRAGELGVQLALLEMGVTEVTANLTDETVIRALQARAARLIGGDISVIEATADETARKIAGLLDSITVEELPLALRGYVVRRVLERSLLIADTEATWATRELLPTTYRRNGIEEMVYRTERDNKVCEICSPDEGTVHPTSGRGHPGLPRHPRCRCWYEPATEGWERPAGVWYGQE